MRAKARSEGGFVRTLVPVGKVAVGLIALTGFVWSCGGLASASDLSSLAPLSFGDEVTVQYLPQKKQNALPELHQFLFGSRWKRIVSDALLDQARIDSRERFDSLLDLTRVSDELDRQGSRRQLASWYRSSATAGFRRAAYWALRRKVGTHHQDVSETHARVPDGPSTQQTNHWEEFSAFISDLTADGYACRPWLHVQLDTQSSAVRSQMKVFDASLLAEIYFLRPLPRSGGSQPEGEHYVISAMRPITDTLSLDTHYQIIRRMLIAGLRQNLIGPLSAEVTQNWRFAAGRADSVAGLLLSTDF